MTSTPANALDDICPLGQIARDNPKIRASYALAEREIKGKSIILCLNESPTYRAAHSYLLSGALNILFIEFNKDFFAGASAEDLTAVTAHEVVHFTDNVHCSLEGGISAISGYLACELAVDIRATRMEEVGRCGMVRALEYTNRHWKKVAPDEVTLLPLRIAELRDGAPCRPEDP